MVYIPNILRTKPLHWVDSAKKDYLDFPDEVQSDMGYALGLRRSMPSTLKPGPGGDGPGVFEIIEDHAAIPIERFTPYALLV
jgi:phage-related protein